MGYVCGNNEPFQDYHHCLLITIFPLVTSISLLSHFYFLLRLFPYCSNHSLCCW